MITLIANTKTKISEKYVTPEGMQTEIGALFLSSGSQIFSKQASTQNKMPEPWPRRPNRFLTLKGSPFPRQNDARRSICHSEESELSGIILLFKKNLTKCLIYTNEKKDKLIQHQAPIDENSIINEGFNSFNLFKKTLRYLISF